MQRPVWLLALALAASGPASETAAQSTSPADTSMVELREVLVRGTRPVATAGGAGSVTARLDSLSLRSVPTAEQVLRALPGTYLRLNSRGETEVTVRGSESRQVALLFDGVPLTFAWDGRADASVIPAMAAQEVTFVRGLSSLVQGPNALGGVVEFSTRPSAFAPRHPTAELRAGADELGGFGLAGTAGVPRDLGWGVFTARAGAGYRDTPGHSLPRNVTEPIPGNDGRRVNTDFRGTSGFLTLRLDSDSGGYLSLAGIGQQAERGIAAQLGVTGARFWRYPHIARGIGVLSAGTGRRAMPWGGQADLHISGGYDRGRTEIDAYDSREYRNITSEEDGNDEVITLRTTATQTLGERADLRLGFSHGSIRHDEILNGVLNEFRQDLWSGAAQTTLRLPGAGLVRQFDLSAGATLDGARTPRTGNKPSFEALDEWGGRFGILAHLGGRGTTAHASVSRRARFPSLRELYSGSLGSFEPNPDLEPENLQAFEAGVTSRTPLGAFQLVGFHHRLSDAVVRIRPPGQNFQRVNQEGVRSIGVEVMTSRAFGLVELSADVVAQKVEVLDPDAGLERPENMPEVMGELRALVPVGGGVFAAADARFTGRQFAIDPENDVLAKLAPAGQLNVEVFRNWTVGDGSGWFRAVQLRAAMDNLTDAPQFDAFGLPQAGRTARIELRLY